MPLSCNHCQLQTEINQSQTQQKILSQEVEALQAEWSELYSSPTTRRRDFKSVRKELESKLEAVKAERERELILINELTYLAGLPEKNQELTAEKQDLLDCLKHATNWIKTLKAELSSLDSEHKVYQTKAEYQIDILRQTLRDSENLLDKKNSTIIDLSQELDQTEAQVNALLVTLKSVVRKRDSYQQEWEDTNYWLEQEQIKNQIVYDTLKSVTLERENLVNKYSNLKGKILRRESKIDACQKTLVKLDQDCAELDNLLAHKNSRLSQVIKEQAEQKEHLNQIIDSQEEITDSKNQRMVELTGIIHQQQEQIKEKNHQKQKQIILLSQQLATDQNKIKDLTELLTKREKEVKNLTKQLTTTQQKLTRTKTYQQNQLTNLANQLTTLTNKHNNLQTNYPQVQNQLLTTYENYLQIGLKVSDLNNLPANNTGQSLDQLISFYNDSPASQLASLKTHVKTVIEEFRDNQMKWHNNKSDRDNELSSELKTNHSITENTWQEYINNATDTNLGQRKLDVLNTLAKLIINRTIAETNSANKSQLNQEQSAHQQTKDKLNAIPNDWDQQIKTAQSEKDQALKEKENYQNQLTQQEQQIVQQLNSTFNLKLDPAEKNLSKAIVEIQKLISKDPLIQTVDNPALQEQLEQAQKTILKLERELTEKIPLGEKIETIIEIDEKLLNQNETLKIELNKQTQDYQELASERNKLVLQQIKNINVQKLSEIIPQVKEEVIQQTLAKTNNYAELAQARNQLIMKHLNSNNQALATQSLPVNPVNQSPTERIIWISLLVVSLISIGGLLVKLKGANTNKEK